jgi:hypothetical protein
LVRGTWKASVFAENFWEALGNLARQKLTIRRRTQVEAEPLPRYFSVELLASTKVVTIDKVPMPPLSKMGLARFAKFESGDFDGITYLDTFFLKKGCAAYERLYFHELIHIVQWSLFGPERFLATYADGLEKYGYRDSPLEMMAYNAEATFVQSPNIFDAEELVANELSRIGTLPLEEK